MPCHAAMFAQYLVLQIFLNDITNQTAAIASVISPYLLYNIAYYTMFSSYKGYHWINPHLEISFFF